ncbi:MAG: hypothetical protein RLZZ252_1578, partial [Bacteroidota bacterium]
SISGEVSSSGTNSKSGNASNASANLGSNGTVSAITNPNLGKRFSGFIAQDVEKVAKSLGYDFSGIDAAQNDKDLYGLRYSEFVVPMVKAIQEQQVQIEELKKMNLELMKEIQALKK